MLAATPPPITWRTRATAVVVALLAAFGALLPSTSAGAASSRVSIGAGVRGPSGLRASVVAKGLQHASAITEDAQGRVWVATAAAQDEGHDGVYLVRAGSTTPVEVVTDVHTPLGLLWLDGTLYVSETGGVLALSGFDGTTFASRTTIVSFPTGTGEVNGIATDGLGRLYVGISAPCDHCTVTDAHSASIVSFRTDGSELQVYASGIRAPVGLAFVPGTVDLLVSMDQRDDLGAKTPGDWLALVRDGDQWGFPECYGQDTAACASVPAPVGVLDAHAAVSGIAVVTGQLGTTVGTGAVVAEWTTGKVRIVSLTSTPSGYEGRTTTLLTGLRNPTAVALGASGALDVGDWTTGKIYRVTA